MAEVLAIETISAMSIDDEVVMSLEVVPRQDIRAIQTGIFINVANLCRRQTRQGSPDVFSRRLGQVIAYLTISEILLLARAEMVCSGVNFAFFVGPGLQS